VSAVLSHSNEWHEARASALQKLCALDISEICCDDSVLAAIRSGNADLVGRVVLAAVNAGLDRRADWLVYGAAEGPDSEDAAAAELQRDYSPLLEASIKQAGRRA